jgi:flavin reductase
MMTWIDDGRLECLMMGGFETIDPKSVETVDAMMFRDAMSQVGAAVHVVTTDGPGGKAGFTATAVCSVSDNPPLLLVCLNRKSGSGRILERNKVFCVNTLRADSEPVADVFAGRTGAVKDERFVTGAWSILKTGAPALDTAVVAFDCQVVDIRLMGSHNVIFGAVVEVRIGAGPALVYHNRSYKRV